MPYIRYLCLAVSGNRAGLTYEHTPLAAASTCVNSLWCQLALFTALLRTNTLDTPRPPASMEPLYK